MNQSLQNSRTIQKEMQLLRSFMIGIAGKDSEGTYRPEFVVHILSEVSDEPRHRFNDASSFLEHLRAS